jgi:undecaprenyl-diphosphatase
VNLLQALILGIVQGATEFLPVSSSAHLVLVPWLFGWPEPGLAFDTLVHWGTLLAVVVYFRDDLVALLGAGARSLTERRIGDDPLRRLAWLIVLGTLPAAALGALFEKRFEVLFSQPQWVAVFLLVTGVILVVGERLAREDRRLDDQNPSDALAIGVAQAVAIVPGISRSGVTIATGLARGLKREEAARFSFLLGSLIIFGAGLFQLAKLTQTPPSGETALAILTGFVAAAVTGYVCIRFLMTYIQRHSLVVFAVYCWLVGLGALALSVIRGG